MIREVMVMAFIRFNVVLRDANEDLFHLNARQVV